MASEIKQTGRHGGKITQVDMKASRNVKIYAERYATGKDIWSGRCLLCGGEECDCKSNPQNQPFEEEFHESLFEIQEEDFVFEERGEEEILDNDEDEDF